VITSLLGFAIAVTTAAVLVRRRREQTPPQRRAQAPMLWAGLTVIVFLGLLFASDTVGVPDGVMGAVGFVGFVAFAILPFAFLAGLVRTRYSRAGAVGGLIERLNTPDTRVGLREALSEALGDPTLQLVYWREAAGYYVTYDGHRVDLPAPGSGRAVAEVERDGTRVGAILHDAALRDDPSLVRAAAAAAALQLENERLEAELRARWRTFRRRGRGSSRCRWASAGVSSAISTTGPSSGSWRCRCSSGSPGARSTATPPPRRGSSMPREPSWAPRSRSSASSRGASTRPSSPIAGWARRCRRSPNGRRFR
jgi:hypothetical protein